MTPARTILTLSAASLSVLALGAAAAHGTDTPQIGQVITTPDNVASIVARTQAQGFPHLLNRTELRDLGQMLSTAVYPLSRHRTGNCRYRVAGIYCGATEILSHTFVYLRVSHVWEDGTARARVVAVVL